MNTKKPTGTVVTKFGSSIYTGPPMEELTMDHPECNRQN